MVISLIRILIITLMWKKNINNNKIYTVLMEYMLYQRNYAIIIKFEIFCAEYKNKYYVVK